MLEWVIEWPDETEIDKSKMPLFFQFLIRFLFEYNLKFIVIVALTF